MIITINTREDTKEEIKKVIAMLSHMINEPIQTTSPDFTPQPSEGFFNMFDQPATPPQPPTEDPEKTARMEIYDY
jgi:hypothetical protein